MKAEPTVKQCKDADEAYKIAKNLPDYFNGPGLKSIKKDTQTHLLYGAYIDNKMVGFTTFNEVNADTVEGTWLGVLPEYQNKNIGTKLLTDSLKELSKKYKICMIKTLSDTHPDKGYSRTRKFFRQLGFIGLETIHPYPGWGDENPCQIFVKWLKN